MNVTTRFLGLFGVSAALALGAGCADSSQPAPLSTPSTPQLANAPSATLLECESLNSFAVTDTIDMLGGTLRVTDAAGGTHEVVFPEDAVSTPTVFTLTVPASKYVEVDVTAEDLLTGKRQSITFPEDAQPTLAVSYKRCTRSNVKSHDLSLFNIDEQTDAVLEGPFGTKEGNTDDPRVVGKVPHFSDYAIGQP